MNAGQVVDVLARAQPLRALRRIVSPKLRGITVARQQQPEGRAPGTRAQHSHTGLGGGGHEGLIRRQPRGAARDALGLRRLGRGLLRRELLFVQRLEIDRLQQQRRKPALADEITDGLARKRQQHMRAGYLQGLVQHLAAHALQTKQAALLHLDQKHGLVLTRGGHGDGQHHLVHALSRVQFRVLNAELHADLRRFRLQKARGPAGVSYETSFI